MPKIDYEDVYDFEQKRRWARREQDEGGLATFAGVMVLIVVVGFFMWLHGSIAKLTGPEAATWIVWAGVLTAIAGGVWLALKRRAERARADEMEEAEQARYAEIGRRRAKEVVVRAKAKQQGLLAEYWANAGHKQHGDPDLLDFEVAQELVIKVYGGWTMIALDEQGHQRLLEDDVCAVFGIDRGLQITGGAWELLDN